MKLTDYGIWIYTNQSNKAYTDSHHCLFDEFVEHFASCRLITSGEVGVVRIYHNNTLIKDYDMYVENSKIHLTEFFSTHLGLGNAEEEVFDDLEKFYSFLKKEISYMQTVKSITNSFMKI